MKKTIFILSLLLTALAVLPLSARTVYVARHAQVGISIKEIKETRITPDLGIKQAQALADHLVKKLNFKGDIYASPFYRTIETASYTAALLNKKVILEPGLQEMAPGPRPSPPGMKLTQIQSYFKGKTVPGKRYADNWRLCKEDNKARKIRVAKALDAILAETKGDVLLVSHGASVNDFGKIFRERLESKKVKMFGGGKQPMAWNCVLFVYEINDQNKLVSAKYITEFLAEKDLTNNYKAPKIERPDDPRYMTRAQEKADRAKRKAQAAAKAAKAKAKAQKKAALESK